MSAINSSIPLLGQVPQIPGPLDQYKEGLSVQTLLNQSALQKQQQQANQVGLQQQQLQLKEQQREENDKQAASVAYKNSGGDMNKFFKSLSDSGVSPDFAGKLQKQHFDTITSMAQSGKAQVDLMDSKNKAIQQAVNTDLASAGQPDEDRDAIHAQERNRLLMSGQFGPTEIPEKRPTDAELKAHQMSGLTVEQYIDAARKKQESDADLAEKAAKLPGEIAESKIKQQEEQLTPQERAGLKAPGTIEDRRYEDIVARQKQGIPVAPPDLAWKGAYEKRKTLVPVAQINLQQSLLTPQAKQALGQQFAETGALPQGMRSPAMSAQIMNEGVKNAAPGIDIAANKATYGADTASLKKLQTNFDNVDAFEKTAGKNLDIFLNQAKKVTDSGVPVLNLPARIVAKNLGSADQAAFETARTTALTEIAKVLNSSNASGVLSDSARHEVEGLIGKDATLPQIVSAANILKQDMGNRRVSYQQQIGEIKGRMQGGGGDSGTAQPASGGLQVGQTVSVKGKQMKVKAVHPDGSFDAE
jgi:hypothetical protein